ncbi:UNVERIFIED_CONTAM: hypothetical protein K2H54_051263 [Gekko kuhli]
MENQTKKIHDLPMNAHRAGGKAIIQCAYFHSLSSNYIQDHGIPLEELGAQLYLLEITCRTAAHKYILDIILSYYNFIPKTIWCPFTFFEKFHHDLQGPLHLRVCCLKYIFHVL